MYSQSLLRGFPTPDVGDLRLTPGTVRVRVIDRSLSSTDNLSLIGGMVRVAFDPAELDDGGGQYVVFGRSGYDSGMMLPKWPKLYFTADQPGSTIEVICTHLEHVPPSLGPGWSLDFGV